MTLTHIIRFAQVLALAAVLAALAAPALALGNSNTGKPAPDWFERYVAAHPYGQGVVDSIPAPDWFERYAASHAPTANAASAASATVVIPYAKTCDETVGHCVGTTGNGGRFEMQVTSFRATGKAAQLSVTEWITVGGISFTAEMDGHVSPAGFIVLNGTVTQGSFAGAQVHQRSNLVSAAGTTTSWTGELRLMPARA